MRSECASWDGIDQTHKLNWKKTKGKKCWDHVCHRMILIQNLLLMVQKSPTTTWETWKKRNVVNYAVDYQPQKGFLAGFLNHQQYHLLRRLFILLTFRVVDLALNQSRQGPWFHQYLDPACYQGTICVGESPKMRFGGQICNLDIP